MAIESEARSEESTDSKDADVGKTPSSAALIRMLVLLKLKLIANYVLDGFAPFVAVIALIVAIIAVNSNKSSQVQLVQNAATIASMNASLLIAKGELEKLKAATAQEKILQEEVRKKQNERTMQIIQSVSKLQLKVKISPTLEEQMYPPVSSSVVQPAIASTAAAKTIVLSGKDNKQGDRMDVLKGAVEKLNKK